jgi:hypothetical protein
MVMKLIAVPVLPAVIREYVCCLLYAVRYSRHQRAESRQQTVDSRQQTADSRQRW